MLLNLLILDYDNIESILVEKIIFFCGIKLDYSYKFWIWLENLSMVGLSN